MSEIDPSHQHELAVLDRSWRPIATLGQATAWLVGITSLCAGVVVAAFVNRLSVIDDFTNGTASPRDFDDADRVLQVSTWGLVIMLLLSGVVWIVWQWRVARNLAELGRQPGSFGPGWSIGAWFVPCANIVLPLLVVRDLWRGADPAAVADRPPARSVSPAIIVWWVLFIIGGVIFRTIDYDRAATIDEFRSADVLGVVGFALFALSGIAAVLVVRQLTARAESVRDLPLHRSPQLGDGGGIPTAPRPPAWNADPTGRHELRYWDGVRWTDHVSTAGVAAVDPA